MKLFQVKGMNFNNNQFCVTDRSLKATNQ